MKRKEFYETWTKEEIDEYVDSFGVLVLFKIKPLLKEAELLVYGNITDEQAKKLENHIGTIFGGTSLTKPMCNKINEFAEKWYRKVILNKRARVINFKKGKKL